MSTRDERPIASLPLALPLLLALLIGVQVMLHHTLDTDQRPDIESIGRPPSAAVLGALSFGEQELYSRLLMLWMQSFDTQMGVGLSYRSMDYDVIVQWLDAALRLAPESHYPLLAAALLYARVDDAAKVRMMLDFVHRAFLQAPNRRWRWLARAATIAKHRLHDIPLAHRYAADLRELTTPGQVPNWARQMEIFMLEDLGEVETARVMLGGLLQSGEIKDPAEARFLKHRLEQMEKKAEPGIRKQR